MMGIFEYRLKAARKKAGLSLDALAKKMGNTITKQAISKFEKGLIKPDGKRLIEFSKALEVTVDYLMRPQVVDDVRFEFRKKSKLGKKAQAAIQGQALDMMERCIEVESIIGESHQLDVSLPAPKSHEDVIDCSYQLRDEWKLGRGPIVDLEEILEQHGIKVAHIDSDVDFDGLLARSGRRALVVVNKKHDPVRKRFTMAHELGHLLLFSDVEHTCKEHEKLCHLFAGFLLLPPTVLRKEVGENRTKLHLQELVRLKEQFGVSIQAIMHMLNTLGVIKKSYYTHLCINARVEKWNMNEPGVYPECSRMSHLEKRVLYAYSENIISLSKAAVLVGMPPAEFQEQYKDAV